MGERAEWELRESGMREREISELRIDIGIGNRDTLRIL